MTPNYINNRYYLRYLAYRCEEAYQVSDLEAAGVELLIEEDDHENVVIAFRGTTFNGEDIIRNIRSYPWYSRELGGWMHRGFLKSARAILPLILKELPDRPPYILTGHSKGGAEATIVAALMVERGYPPEALVTFGAPLAGGPRLREILKTTPGHRVTNRGDPVPSVPWLLSATGVFQHHRGATEVDTNLNGSWDDLNPTNHKISRYIDAIGYSA